MLKGMNVNTAFPFIPVICRSEEVPTIFWIKPKNLEVTYKSINRYAKAKKQVTKGHDEVDTDKLFDADSINFLEACSKVENYEFSDRYPELSKLGGISEITTREHLVCVIGDLDPTVFQEVMNATSDWALLKEGNQAYNDYIAKKKLTA
jgi:hypothetical protein